MEYIKNLIHELPSEELRANVQVCLEHSCAIFLGDYRGLSQKEEASVKNCMNLDEGEPDDTDLEFKKILEVFQKKINTTQSLWHSMKSPFQLIKPPLSPLQSVILGTIQAFEMSEVPPIIPAMIEALITGQWKIFILTSVGLMSPSEMKLEVINQIVMYSVKEDFLEWCKREVVCDDVCESFNLYTNQTMQPLEKFLGESPET